MAADKTAAKAEQAAKMPAPKAAPTLVNEDDTPALTIRRALESRPEQGQTKPAAKSTEPEKGVSPYRAKLLAWFNTGFLLSKGIVPCSELKGLRTRVTVTFGEERRVTNYSVTEASGNSLFDERARASMDRLVGELLPPPPPLYPEFNPRTLAIVFSGRDAACDDDAPRAGSSDGRTLASAQYPPKYGATLEYGAVVQPRHRFLGRAACWASDLRCVAVKGAFGPVRGT